jgi:hypothetical protein
MVHPNVSWDLLHSVQVKSNPPPSPRWHNSWLIFLITRYTPNLNKVSFTIFDVIGFVLGIKCITHSHSSQIKKFHVTFLIWIGEVVIRSFKWHGEVTKIGVIKRYSQQCPTADDRKGWVIQALHDHSQRT